MAIPTGRGTGTRTRTGSGTLDRVYIYKEDSARANTLIRHISKYNPDVIIELETDFSNWWEDARKLELGMELEMEMARGIDASNRVAKPYYFILSEKGIKLFHDQRQSTDLARAGVDYLNLVFPTLEQSRLETSKLYCRQFLEKSHLGLSFLNPRYEVITHETALEALSFKDRVIKADGLAGGKGVFVYGDHFETDSAARDITRELLEVHEQLLLEERLEGEEFSCICLSWRGVITHFPLVRDFKRLEDGDRGANTGGMGTISFPGGSMPFLTDEELGICRGIMETIVIETDFRGFLYGSFMKTRDGKLKLIEYNVRLGDSEGVNILESLESSLLDFLVDPVANPLIVNWNNYTYFRYLVPRGYARNQSHGDAPPPARCNKFYMVDANMPVAAFYLANSMYVHGDGYGHGYGDWSVGGLYSIGTSRTCGIFSSGVDVNSVIAENDQLVRLVYGDLHFRRDIGKKMLDMLKKGCGYGDDRDSDRDSRKDKDLNVVGMNYLGHLNNYNHIITDVKKEIDRHNNAMELAKPGLKVLGRIGDFANSVEWSKCRMICSVDGAGTKTKFLEGHPRRFEILGRDIVVHNINDMYCNNGRPIALLDYYGCDKLDKREFAEFVNGALEVCKKYGIALIGGETAEMRGIFQTGEVEVLGILLGVLDDGVDVANGYNIKAGHVVYGLESHGAHTNGFTKLREVASRAECNNSSSGSSSSSWSVSGMPLEVREFFSQPHRCYVPVVEGIKKLLQQDSDGNHEIVITGKAHITGGGFIDNIERILPDGLKLELEGWPLAMEWQWLIQNAKMEWDEFIRVFNAGWGFCLVLNNEIPDDILRKIEFDNGLGKIKKIGKIVRKQ